MWKVTDVCDPAICTDPFTVRVEEYKASYLWYHREGPRPAKQAYAYFSPCWADGLRQDLYANEVPGPKLLVSESSGRRGRHLRAQSISFAAALPPALLLPL